MSKVSLASLLATVKPQGKSTSMPVFEEIALADGPVATPQRGKKGDAARGQLLLDRMLARAPRGPVPAGYDPLAEYDALWRQGGADSLRDMPGYDEVRGHVGVVEALGAWQPRLRFFDLIVLNSSAGKDSAAMMVAMRALAEEQGVLHRVRVVHADLGVAEHPGVRELAGEQAHALGLPFYVIERTIRGVRKDLLQRFVENMQDKFLVTPRAVADSRALTRLGFAPRADTDDDAVWMRYAHKKERATIQAALLAAGFVQKDSAKGNPPVGSFQLRVAGGFPGFGTRYCTSEFKTGEVSKWTTGFLREDPDLRARLEGLGRPARVLNVLGLRAQESPKRAGPGFEMKGAGTRARVTYEWLPIQTITDGTLSPPIGGKPTRPEVWDLIAAGGLRYHPVYDVDFKRLSCRLCPLAGDEDVALAALVYPELRDQILDIEATYGFLFKETRGLQAIIDEGIRRNPRLPEMARVARKELADLAGEGSAARLVKRWPVR